MFTFRAFSGYYTLVVILLILVVWKLCHWSDYLLIYLISTISMANVIVASSLEISYADVPQKTHLGIVRKLACIVLLVVGGGGYIMYHSYREGMIYCLCVSLISSIGIVTLIFRFLSRKRKKTTKEK